MIYFIILAVFVVSLVGVIIYEKYRGDSEFIATTLEVLMIVSGLSSVILTIWSIAEYSNNLNIRTQLETFEQKEKILTEKSNSTLELLKIEVERYYKYELEIFRDIKPENVDVLLVKYPELKTSALVMGYMEQIIKLNNDIYDLRFRKTDYEAKLSWYKQNQLIF